MTVKQAIDEYKEVYMASRNFAQRTRVEYSNDLEDLRQFLEQLGLSQLKNLDLLHLVKYLAELDRRGLAGVTRIRKVVSIRSFLGYLYQSQYIRLNLAQRLIPPFVSPTSPRYLTKSESERLLAVCIHNPRDFALVQLFLQTGIKLSELINLTLDDLELPSEFNFNETSLGYIHIRSNERRKARIISINYSACLALGKYTKMRSSVLISKLFVNRLGNPLGSRGVEKILKKYLKQIGIYDAGVQSLRHTYGITRTAQGTDLKALRKTMGLKDYRSTLAYDIIAKNLIKKDTSLF